MGSDISLLANTLNFMEGGGHFWVYLNWALGLRANGRNIHWIEVAPPNLEAAELKRRLSVLRERLKPHGLDHVVIIPEAARAALKEPPDGFDLAASASELLINFAYGVPGSVLERFRRTALIDIDPGLTQLWISRGEMPVPAHAMYFTTGETVGAGGRIPDCGLRWHYTPPCVALSAWPLTATPDGAPFTTVSQWYAEEWVTADDGPYCNDKRHGFLPFLDLPHLTRQPLELALDIGFGQDADEERRRLEARGWRIRHSYDVAGTPDDYQRYIQSSRGEFSAVKPSCVHLQNAWISDRTLCYLASGKPAIVQHTGPSRFLPTSAGLFRFQTLQEAAAMLERVADDYAHQCRLARALAEEYFDAGRVTQRLLERALP